MRFQLVVATLAIGAAFVLTDSQGPGPSAEPVLTFQDGTIDESSGLVDAGPAVLTVNDSGDGPVVYVVDRSTGETVGRTTYTDDEVVDVEALASGPDDTLWVGDIGDNSASRVSVAVYALPVPGPGDRTVEAQRYDFVYAGGPRDAEALLVHPTTGRLYVVSKGVFGGQLFEAPRELSADQPNTLRPVADVDGLVTDGAFFPDGRFAALRSYSNLTVLEADGWRNVQGMRLPDQDQGEGLAVSPDGESVLLSTEGARTEVLELPFTEAILERVAEPARPAPSAPAESARPAPSAPAESARPAPSAPAESARPDELPSEGQVAEMLGLASGTLVLVGGVVLWRRRRRTR